MASTNEPENDLAESSAPEIDTAEKTTTYVSFGV